MKSKLFGLIAMICLCASAQAQHHKIIITGTTTTNLSMSPIPNHMVGDTNFTVATSSNSSATKTFGTTDGTVAYVNTSTGRATIVAAGTVTFTVSQPAITGYTSGSAKQTFTVYPSYTATNTNLAISTLPNKTVGDSSFYVTTTSANPAPKLYGTTNGQVAYVNTSTGKITVVSAGTYTIVCSQPADTVGTTIYPAASVSTTGTVLAAPIVSSNTRQGVYYYVDPTTTNDSMKGTITAPYRTMAQVQSVLNNTTTLPAGGINVAFKCGTSIRGKLYLSGKVYTSSSPLYFLSYGTGSKPKLQHDMTGTSSVNRTIFYFDNGCSYINISGLNFTDTTMSTLDHTITANVGYAIVFAKGGSYNTVNGCDITLIGDAIQLESSYSSVTNCDIENLRMVRNTVYVDAATQYDDYGANGVTVEGSYDVVDNCIFKDLWDMSYDFTWDGGAIEIFDNASNFTCTHNTFENCEGVTEVGSSGSGTFACNNHLYAYNLFINNGRFLWMNVNHSAGSTNSVTVSNWQYFNNTFVETVMQRNKYPYLMSEDIGESNHTEVKVYNNVFYILTTVKMISSVLSANNQVVADYNLYRMDTTQVNYTSKGSHEHKVGATASIFQNTTNSSPYAWDYHLLSTSAAVEGGTSVTSFLVGTMPAVDYFGAGALIGNYPDCGLSEYPLQ